MVENQQEVLMNDIQYLIDEKARNAIIIYSELSKNDIIIPRSIKYNSNEYIITCISESAFYNTKINSVEFSSDSEIQFIGKEAFSYTPLKSLSIPSSLINLRDGWCSSVKDLNKVYISPNNPRYSLYENKMIIGKSTLGNQNYDEIVFCCRNAKHVTIPNFIKTIKSHAFHECEQLYKIEFQTNSKLEIINEYAFRESGIRSFSIQKTVTQIKENSFSICSQLQSFEIPHNSNLQKISNYVFSSSSIVSLLIPPRLSSINLFLYNCTRIQIIEFNENSTMERIDADVFSFNDQLLIMIPSNLIYRLYFTGMKMNFLY